MHCDVKPANFVCRRDGGCVLIDFDMAVSEGSQVDCHHGTPMYVAPEVLAQGCVTKAADAWSLGIMLWQLLHREEHPFCLLDDNCTDNVRKLTAAVLQYRYDPEVMWRSGDHVAGDLCARLLDREPSRRMTAVNALNHTFFKRIEHLESAEHWNRRLSLHGMLP